MAYRIVNRFGTLQWEYYEEKPIPERSIRAGECTSCGQHDQLAGVSEVEEISAGKGRVKNTRYLCNQCFMDQVWNKH